MGLDRTQGPGPAGRSKAAAGTRRARPPPGGGRGDPCVLLLTPDLAVARTVCRALHSTYQVTVATDTSYAQEQLLRLRPDAVLIDADLLDPYRDEFLEGLRRQPEPASVPVVVLVDAMSGAARARLLKAGAWELVCRPIADEELRLRVDRWVAQRWMILALHRDEETWHALFEQASDGIFVTDAAGRCVDVNGAACQLLLQPRERILGSTTAQMGPWSAGALPQPAPSAPPAHGVHSYESRLVRGDGDELAVEVSEWRLSDGRRILCLRDIEERQQRLRAAESLAEQLERRVADRTLQLRQLAAALDRVESRERGQIARDLHDGLGQTLAAIGIRLSALSRHRESEVREIASEIGRLIREAQRATSSLAAQLAPPVLSQLGLVPALEWLAEEIRTGFSLQLTVDDDGAPKPLSQEARTIVYRAVRELVINVAKHAQVERALVQLRVVDGALSIRVRDEGVGGAPGLDEQRAAVTRSLGLRSVRERLSYLGGGFELHSAPNRGTEAILTLPLSPPD